MHLGLAVAPATWYKEEINQETGEKERKLTCTKPEIELHTHGPECYETIKNDDGTETKKLICGKLEVKSHVHGQGCFEESPVETETNEDEASVNEESSTQKAPMLMASAPKRASATNNWQVKVDKTWSDGSTDHEPVVVNLMTRDEDGSESNTGKTITLSSANNWAASFTGLYKDDSFEYFVKEENIQDWDSAVTDNGNLTNETWDKVTGTTLNSGSTYVLVPYSYPNYALGFEGITLSSSTDYSTFEKITNNGSTLQGYIPNNLRWTLLYDEDENTYNLFNEGTKTYMYCSYMNGYTKGYLGGVLLLSQCYQRYL